MDFRVEGVSHSFEGQPVLTDITCGFRQGELFSLVGPSGAGKTTLLSLIAGLIPCQAGTIQYAQTPDLNAPIILVYQDFILFPHLTVADNVGFGLKARKWSRATRRSRVEQILRYFQLEDKADAFPAQLSGGQRQRVAIARAMVVSPAVLLLDEPFANLDRSLKMETARFIRSTQREFGMTTVAVTHDLEEAFAMSDRLGILLNGRLRQVGPPREVYFHPQDLEVARFLGPVNPLTPATTTDLLPPGTGIPSNDAFIRPEALEVEGDANGPGCIRDIHFAGHYIMYTIDLRGQEIIVYSQQRVLEIGQRVRVRAVQA